MAFKFNCEHCGEELIVYFLKKGEESQCPACVQQTIVLESAVQLDLPRPVKIQRPLLPIIQDEERRREDLQEKIENYSSVKEISKILNIIWYAGIIIIPLIILTDILVGDDFALFSDPTLNLAIDVKWDEAHRAVAASDIWETKETVILGHNNINVFVPGGFWPTSVAVDFLLSAIMVLAILFFLRRFFKTAVTGQPFTKANSWNLRWVGYLVFFWDPFFNIVKISQANSFLDELTIEGAKLGTSWSIDFKAILAGLAIIAIAHLFEMAAKIQHENELTI